MVLLMVLAEIEAGVQGYGELGVKRNPAVVIGDGPGVDKGCAEVFPAGDEGVALKDSVWRNSPAYVLEGYAFLRGMQRNAINDQVLGQPGKPPQDFGKRGFHVLE